METRTLTGDLVVINRGMYSDAVAVCLIPDSATLELFFYGREIELGNYKFYTSEHSEAKKLEVNILGIHFNFDGFDAWRNKSQDVCVGDKYSRYSPTFYGIANDAPIEAILLAGVKQDLPLNEEVKAVVFRFLKEVYTYFYGRGYNLYETKE